MNRPWCDLSCRHASFPRQTALQGACNTLQALYCGKHKRFVPKNAPCLDEKKQGRGGGASRREDTPRGRRETGGRKTRAGHGT